jgi:hypothetical protein
VNPDVVDGISRLEAQHVLTSEQAALFDRVARRRLVSVWLEIRALLYVGVLLVTSGVGLLVSEHHQEIGPWIIAAALGIAAAACFVWVDRRAAPFSWAQVPSPNAAFDYVLLLGVMLLASELAYVEAEFTILGRHWPHHLLVVAAVGLAAAYRWDSRTILGLALATLAAWRGISVGLISDWVWRADAGDLRASAIMLGALYLAAAWCSVTARRKAHFEEVFASAGLLLLLGALVSGVLDRDLPWGVWLVALLVAAGAVLWVSFRLGRSLYFAQGVVAAYVGLLRLLFAPFHHGMSVPLLLSALLGVAALALVFAAHRRMTAR